MIQVKPHPDNHFTCPECGSGQPVINDVIIESVHAMADCTCSACGLAFYQGLPVGHAALNVLSIGKSNGQLYQQDNGHAWLSESFLRAHQGLLKNEVAIKKIVFKECENVVILNTLDSLYGHTLLKLYNAMYHLDHPKGLGLIIIIPRMFEWLIPKGCAEAWVVDLKLSDLMYGYESIQKFVSGEFKRFQKIYLSNAYSHPGLNDKDIERLTGVRPFDLGNFSKQKPTVTFVLREDRLWFKSKLDYWFYRASRKLNRLPWARIILANRQNQLVKKAIQAIRKKLPEVDIYVVGLGTPGALQGHAIDERKTDVDVSVERRWCEIYGRSHVVVGIHGSNMLLPTALAAGCVEILPEDRYGNIVQDLTIRYTDRLQLFFYRFVEQYAHPASVVSKVLAIIGDYDLYDKNMCRNLYRESGSAMTVEHIGDDARH